MQKIVFPRAEHSDRLPLYIEPEPEATASAALPRFEVLSRRSLRLTPGTRSSFATYFNAFPASYWRHWTSVRQVSLIVAMSGSAVLIVRRSNARGTIREEHAARIDSETPVTSQVDLDINENDEGGWVWFEVDAGDQGAVLHRAHWATNSAPVRDGRTSIGITTHNKPDYCVQTLSSLNEMEDLDSLVDRVFVLDQGDRAVRDEAGFSDAAALLSGRLEVIEQDNLGGSGGFSRAMSETLQRADSDGVLLLDDDVSIEPEALRRAMVFAQHTTIPTIVGGHMFDLRHPTRLHALAEVVDRGPFGWRPVNEVAMPLDLERHRLPTTALLHQRYDTDFNGWWMCLIPRAVLERLGLALPAFIKWDDAEYGLRAGAAGVPTVSLPGAALWHVTWTDKDDLTDWQAYFHARNRIVAALLHSPERRGGELLTHSRRMDLKHLMAMQYYATTLRHLALRDILSGPDHMFPSLRSALPRARDLAQSHPEAVVAGPINPDDVQQVEDPRSLTAPTGWKLRTLTLSSLLRHWVRPRKAEQSKSVFLPRTANAWWVLTAYDSAVVATGDGGGTTRYVRDRRAHRHLLVESVRLHRQMRREWPALSRAYRASLTSLTSPTSWAAAFNESADS
nr:glycosyltransferase [Microbacterium aquimaris]